jgi:hypothetical protein
MSAGRLACMTTPASGSRVPAGALWAADNGVFGAGYPGDAPWWSWLESRPFPRGRCLFATAPDVVADAAATLQRSGPWLDRIRGAGYPAALVGQDGLEDLPVPWEAFDVLFLGGSTGWKLGPAAAALVAEARARGKRVHMGRVSSRRRWSYAEHIGCDTVDGTFLAFGPDRNLPSVLSWTDQLALQF